jgi:branched-chain amino acid transport system permease protein
MDSATEMPAVSRRAAPRLAWPTVATAGAVVGSVGGVAMLGSHALLSLLAQAAITAVLALGVGFLLRTLGLVSFGHAAPFGLGAYGASYALAARGPVPVEAWLLLVVVAVVLAFFLVGLLVSRLEGIGFAMFTLAVGEAVAVAATKFRVLTGGADGRSVNLPARLLGVEASFLQQPAGMFLAAVLTLALLYVALRLFDATHPGKLAVAIRENEQRATFLGYRTRVLRAAVYGVSAGIASLGGVLFAMYQGFVSPEILHWTSSGSALIMAILGGRLAVWGPIAGAFAFFFARDKLGDVTTHWLAILGVSLIVVTVVWPNGLSGGVLALRARLARAAAKEGRP